MENGSRRFAWWGAFLCVMATTVSLFGTTAYDKNWLWVAVLASLFAPFLMLGIKYGDGDP